MAICSAKIFDMITEENRAKKKAAQFDSTKAKAAITKRWEGDTARKESSEPYRDHKAEDARSTVGQVAARAKVSRHKARQAIAVIKAVEAGELPKTVIDDVMAGKKQLKDVAPKSPKEDKGEEVARIAEPSQPCLPGMGNPRPNLSKAQLKALPPQMGRAVANRAIRILEDIQDHDAQLEDAIKLLRGWCDQKESKTQGHQECLPTMENTRPILSKAQVKALPPRMGWQIAGRAIWVLEAIEKNDADRTRGFQRVKDWIAANETVSQASRGDLLEIAAPATSLTEPETGPLNPNGSWKFGKQAISFLEKCKPKNNPKGNFFKEWIVNQQWDKSAKMVLEWIQNPTNPSGEGTNLRKQCEESLKKGANRKDLSPLVLAGIKAIEELQKIESNDSDRIGVLNRVRDWLVKQLGDHHQPPVQDEAAG